MEKPWTVASLLQALATALGSGFRDLAFDRELSDPRPNVLILVNGREMGLMGGMETTLEDGDLVTIIPVSHGG